MKIRIAKESLRFRISEEELKSLESSEVVNEKVNFPNNSELNISIQVNNNVADKEFSLAFKNNCISLSIHSFLLEELKENPKQGIKINMPKLVCYVEVDLHKRN